MKNSSGFTLPELIVVMIIMSILATIAYFIPTFFLVTSRDAERQDDTSSIARRLEQAYMSQEAYLQPVYPTTTQLISDMAGPSGSVARLSPDAFKAPNATSTSLIAATSNSLTAPAAAGQPTISQYVYQPLTASDALCTGSMTCVKFNLYWRTEKGLTLQVIRSLHQQ